MLRFLKKQPIEVIEDISLLNRLEDKGVAYDDLLTVSKSLYQADQYRRYRRGKSKPKQLDFDF